MNIEMSKGLQCALTAITIVAPWQLPHLKRGIKGLLHGYEWELRFGGLELRLG